MVSEWVSRYVVPGKLGRTPALLAAARSRPGQARDKNRVKASSSNKRLCFASPFVAAGTCILTQVLHTFPLVPLMHLKVMHHLLTLLPSCALAAALVLLQQ